MGEPAAPAPKARSSAQVIEVVGRIIERGLRHRVRYRYVRPRVVADPGGWRIVSPCCSRKIDPLGGLIDIALLRRSRTGGWTLFARDHAQGTWIAQEESDEIRDLLDAVCLDPKHVYWP